jgi:hypothetical protein
MKFVAGARVPAILGFSANCWLTESAPRNTAGEYFVR